MISLDEKLRRLTETVLLLASDVPQQLDAFPDWVCRVCEVALAFDDCAHFAAELRAVARITDEQLRAVQAIDSKLPAMSGPANAELWTNASLRDDPGWCWVRQQARELLQTMKVPLREPLIDWLTYVPARRSRYCTQCGYDLRGNTSNRCPECGRGFDPADPTTYAPDDGRSMRGPLIRLCVGMPLLLFVGPMLLHSQPLIPHGALGWTVTYAGFGTCVAGFLLAVDGAFSARRLARGACHPAARRIAARMWLYIWLVLVLLVVMSCLGLMIH
jgi:hypothetical protein